MQDGLLWGENPSGPIVIEENGLRFLVNLGEGQKTGFYLDQRDNRRAVAALTVGRRVLDAFCYTGGFGLNAVRQGAAGPPRGDQTIGQHRGLAPVELAAAGHGGRLDPLDRVFHLGQRAVKIEQHGVDQTGRPMRRVIGRFHGFRHGCTIPTRSDRPGRNRRCCKLSHPRTNLGP